MFAEFLSRETLLKLELRANHLTDQSFGTTLQQNSEGTSVFSPLKNLQELSLETNQLTMIPSSALSVQKETLKNLNLGLNMVRNLFFIIREGVLTGCNGLSNTLNPDLFLVR